MESFAERDEELVGFGIDRSFAQARRTDTQLMPAELLKIRKDPLPRHPDNLLVSRVVGG